MASQCMDFCHALASHQKVFTFSLTVGSTFAFSLDTRESLTPAAKAVKRKSPSATRRNAKRRTEFLKKKSDPLSSGTTDFIDVTLASRDGLPASAHKDVLSSSNPPSMAPTCNQCDYKAASEKGLRQHARMKHKSPQLDSGPPPSSPSTPESLRESTRSNSPTMSPISDGGREENQKHSVSSDNCICGCGDEFDPCPHPHHGYLGCQQSCEKCQLVSLQLQYFKMNNPNFATD